MKTLTCLLLLLVLSTSTLLSQRIYFCENFTTSGDPIKPASAWTIDANAGNVYVLLQNGGRAFNVNAVTFHIDILSGNDYKIWDTKILTVGPDRTHCVLDYKFTTAGEFRFTALVNAVEVAKEFVSIKYKSTATTASSVSTSSVVTTDNYASSSVSPGTDIDLKTGQVYGLNGPFYLNSNYVSKVYFKVSNGGKKLATTKLIVDISKKDGTGTYQFYKTQNFDISDLDWVYFPFEFSSAGAYKVMVYNHDSKWINTTYVTIN